MTSRIHACGKIAQTKRDAGAVLVTPPGVALSVRSAKMRPHSTPIVLSDDDIARFWSKVDQSGGPDACWEWQAGHFQPKPHERIGYGAFYLGRQNRLAHRIAWVLANGRPIADGLLVCHTCDNPPCCNPAHLFLGTVKDNADDMWRKGRGKSVGARNRTSFDASWSFGENAYRAKISEAQAREIRRRYRAGESPSLLADEFSLSRCHVSHIGLGRVWRHLNDD